ncbi:hypothetical protein PHYPO_G00186000 [Pangasianodon hypophthalmus]|uniref:Uncharacterized protein n=1 Tax=Pangasianodon hypophthalmus TaxID=310915 RepID=A0A5N5JDQ5_PANHP|nr:hypothetical protein PHYPO_G00186000 [Pangasianodon hypophthalmus]
MDAERLLRSLIEDPFPYIKDPSALGQFTNTCVLDSLLAALHTAYIKFPNIKEILNRNDFFTEVMSLLKEKRYIKTRIVCVQELNLGKVDLYGNVKDYFPLIAKLKYAEITFKQKLPNDAIYKEIPSMFKQCGDVMVLGDPSDPTLILVHREVHNVLYQDCKSTELPLHVDDEKNRTFALQFLLLGKEEHMTI